jgi:hypothetical protein
VKRRVSVLHTCSQSHFTNPIKTSSMLVNGFFSFEASPFDATPL